MRNLITQVSVRRPLSGKGLLCCSCCPYRIQIGAFRSAPRLRAFLANVRSPWRPTACRASRAAFLPSGSVPHSQPMLQLQRNLPTDHAAVAEGPGGRDHAAIAEGPGGLDSSSERRGRSLVVGVCGGSQGRRGRSGYPGDRDGRRDNSPDMVEIGGRLWTTGEIRTPENSDGDFHRETPTLYVEPPPGLSLEPPPGLGPTSPWPDWVSNWESSVGRGPPPEDVTRSGTNDGTRGQENLDRHGRGDTGATYYGATYCPIWRWAKEGPDSGQDGSSRPGNTAVAEEPEIGKPSANKCRTNRTGTTQTVNTRAPGLGDPKLVHIDSLLAQGFFAKGMSPSARLRPTGYGATGTRRLPKWRCETWAGLRALQKFENIGPQLFAAQLGPQSVPYVRPVRCRLACRTHDVETRLSCRCWDTILRMQGRGS